MVEGFHFALTSFTPLPLSLSLSFTPHTALPDSQAGIGPTSRALF
uniref:Uncharacterized protein n=1 Tax=Ascaris lumbricoides TaxID=6252 RepID=A0A0M3IWT6_ASCLU